MSTDPAPTSRLIEITGLKLFALAATLVIGSAVPFGMPYNVEAIAVAFATSNTNVGIVIMVELLTIAVTTLVAAQYTSKMNIRATLLICFGTIIAANAASIWAPGLPTFGGFRVIAGVGTGIVTAIVMSVAGRSRNPAMTFGIITSGVGVMGMILAQVVPRAIAEYGLPGAYTVYIAFGVLGLPLILFFPRPAAATDASGAAAGAPPCTAGLKGWAGLVGLGFIFLGHGALVAFLMRIGISIEISPAMIGNVFFGGAVFAVIAPLISGYLGSKLPSVFPVSLILTVLVIGAFLLGNADTPIEFYLFGPLFGALPLAMMPMILAAIARVDASGKLTGAHPAFLTFGGAIAPLFGGITSDYGGYPATALFTIACLVLGSALLAGLGRQADRLRRETAI